MVEKSLRVVFCGTSEFAVPSLEALAASRHRVAVVVTQPDAPSGRGRRMTVPPVTQAARRLGLAVWQPESLRPAGALTTLRKYQPQVLVVAAYGRILPPSLLSVPPLGTIGMHPSLLPKYRGAAPIQRALLAGETLTGVTTFQVVEAVDAGPILLQRPVPIRPDDTAATLCERLAREGAELLVATLETLGRHRLMPRPQDETQATTAPKLTKADGALDWSRSAESLRDQVRALVPWPGAFTRWNGRLLKVLAAEVASSPLGDRRMVEPGVIAVAADGRLLVGTGDRCLALTQLQPEGRRPMTAADFLAGYRVTPGMRFESVARDP